MVSAPPDAVSAGPPLVEAEASSGVLGAIAAAWRRTQRDPFGVLLPAVVALLLQAAVVVWWWRLALPPLESVGVGVALLLGVGLVVAPLRAAILGAGARAGGRRGPGMRRGLSMLGVVVLVGAAQGLAVGAVVVLWALGASLLLSYGLLSAAALYGAMCLVVGVLVSFALRVRLAYAPVLAVDGGRAAWRALARPPGVAWGRTAAVVLTSDVLFATGTLLAGAGALPGFALRDLALQRLWEDLP